METLPVHLLAEVLVYLPPTDIMVCRDTNKQICMRVNEGLQIYLRRHELPGFSKAIAFIAKDRLVLSTLQPLQ